MGSERWCLSCLAILEAVQMGQGSLSVLKHRFAGRQSPCLGRFKGRFKVDTASGYFYYEAMKVILEEPQPGALIGLWVIEWIGMDT